MKKIAEHKKKRSGFTLLESLFAAFLIGLVIAALAASSGAFTMANAAAVDLSTAEFLIEEIRELTVTTPFASLSIGIVNYSPPRDVNNEPLDDFDAFSQHITIRPVSSTDFTSFQAGSDFKNITVKIIKNGSPISEASWIRANLD